jgi:hypothetical protein
MPERHNDGKNIIGTIRIQLCAKSFILQMYDVLARHSLTALPHQLTSRSELLTVSHFLVEYPFASRLFANSLDAVDHVKRFGRPAILSEGDVVFQPQKIRRTGLYDAFGVPCSFTFTRNWSWTTSKNATLRITTSLSTTSFAS